MCSPLDLETSVTSVMKTNCAGLEKVCDTSDTQCKMNKVKYVVEKLRPMNLDYLPTKERINTLREKVPQLIEVLKTLNGGNLNLDDLFSDVNTARRLADSFSYQMTVAASGSKLITYGADSGIEATSFAKILFSGFLIMASFL